VVSTLQLYAIKLAVLLKRLTSTADIYYATVSHQAGSLLKAFFSSTADIYHATVSYQAGSLVEAFVQYRWYLPCN
jgi:hypothetical protein